MQQSPEDFERIRRFYDERYYAHATPARRIPRYLLRLAKRMALARSGLSSPAHRNRRE